MIGEAATAAEALARVPALRPDVAVLDVRLPDGDGVRCAGSCARSAGPARCLMLTRYSDDEALFDAIMAGASGYLLKQIRGRTWSARSAPSPAGSRCWTRGDGRGAGADAAGRPSRQDPLAELSEQERTVLELIGEGLTNRQIGERMFLAEKTVKNYVSHLLAKLGMERRTQAAVLATELRAPPHRDAEAAWTASAVRCRRTWSSTAHPAGWPVRGGPVAEQDGTFGTAVGSGWWGVWCGQGIELGGHHDDQV